MIIKWNFYELLIKENRFYNLREISKILKIPSKEVKLLISSKKIRALDITFSKVPSYQILWSDLIGYIKPPIERQKGY